LDCRHEDFETIAAITSVCSATCRTKAEEIEATDGVAVLRVDRTRGPAHPRGALSSPTGKAHVDDLK